MSVGEHVERLTTTRRHYRTYCSCGNEWPCVYSRNLTNSQIEWVKGKAEWEGLRVADVVRSYEIPDPAHLNDDGTGRRCADCVPSLGAWDHGGGRS